MKKLKVLFINTSYFPRFSQLGKEFIWISIGQGAAVIGGLIGLRLLTDYLSPAAFGEIALIMTVAALINQLLLGPLAGAALRFLSPAHEARDIRGYLAATRRLVQRVTLLVIILTAAAALLLAGLGYTEWLVVLVTAVSYALFTGYSTVLNGMQNALRQRKVVAWHAALGQWLQVIFVLAAVIYLGPTSQYAMVGYLAAAICILPSQLFFFKGKIASLALEDSPASRPLEDAHYWQDKMQTYALPFAGWGAFTWAQMSSDRWALQWAGSTTTVGYFSVLYRLGYYPISLATNLMVQLLTPILFQKAGDAQDRSRMAATYRANNWLVMAALGTTAVAVIVTFLFNDFIFSLFVAPQYGVVSGLLPWMVLAGGLFATGQIATIGLLSETETNRLIAPKIVTAVLGTLLNFAAAYLWGLAGVVGALSFTALIYVGWIVLLARQRQKEQRRFPSSAQFKDALPANENLVVDEQEDTLETFT